MQPIDFLAIGDVVTEPFIRLKDAEVYCDINNANCTLSMRFGDKIPYESATLLPCAGNSANAAVAAARLGLRSAIVTNVGSDVYGTEAIAALAANNVGTQFVKANEGKKTNYHYVLWYADDRTILIKHEEYDYTLPDIGEPSWIYLSSSAENSLAFHDMFADYLEAHPKVKLAFQPGTFQMKFGAKRLARIYARTEAFFVNLEEARRILGDAEGAVITEVMEKLHKLGPKIVAVTDGPRGAYASDGSDMWFMPPYPDRKPPLERTGAGDAFASTVTAALALGKDLPEALRWGPVNSMTVVQEIGAQKGLLTREALENFLANAPASYKAGLV
jgi:ribokinase